MSYAFMSHIISLSSSSMTFFNKFRLHILVWAIYWSLLFSSKDGKKKTSKEKSKDHRRKEKSGSSSDDEKSCASES